MSKFQKNILSYFVPIVIIMIFGIPFLAEAGDVGGPGQPSIEIKNPFNCSGSECSIPGFINMVLEKILLPIGGVIAVLMIIWAGLLYVTARGDTTKIARAHDALLWTVIGAAILLGATVISKAIQATIDQLKV